LVTKTCNGTFARYRRDEVVNSSWTPAKVIRPDLPSIAVYNLVPDSPYLFVVQSLSCCSTVKPLDEQLSEQVAARTRSELHRVFTASFHCRVVYHNVLTIVIRVMLCSIFRSLRPLQDSFAARIYSVCHKKSLLQFSNIFSQTVGNF